MKNLKRNDQIQINSGSMADIAFLLLIFFMITTTIADDKGIPLLLPAHNMNTPPAKMHERNIFKIMINSEDKLLVEGEPRQTLSGLRNEIEHFILNNGRSDALSETPQKAVISLKTNRGTSHKMFIKTLDEVKAAYYKIYASRVNITPAEYRNLSLLIPEEKELFEQGKKEIPMNISIAEPTN